MIEIKFPTFFIVLFLWLVLKRVIRRPVTITSKLKIRPFNGQQIWPLTKCLTRWENWKEEKDNRSTHIGAQFRWSCFQICTKLAKILDTIFWPSVLIPENLPLLLVTCEEAGEGMMLVNSLNSSTLGTASSTIRLGDCRST